MLQRSILGLVLFNNFINDLEEVTECLLTKIADYTDLGVPFNTFKAHIQRSLDRLKVWSNLMKFKEVKCKVLLLEGKSPWHQHRLILPGWGQLYGGAPRGWWAAS